MSRACCLLTVVLLIAAPAGDLLAQQEAAEQLIDLRVDQTRPSEGLDGWLRRHGDDLRPCAWGQANTPALLGTVRAGVVIFTRSHAGAQPSGKIFQAEDDAVAVDATKLDLGTAGGLDLTVLSALGSALELEIRYFGADGWSTSQTAEGGVRFEGFGAAIESTAQRLEYASELENFEVNFRPRVTEGMPLVIGFRTLQLHERLALWSFDSQTQNKELGTRTNNFLYGLQVGAEPYLLGANSPLRLDGLLKAGIYANHAWQHTSASPLEAAVAARRDRSAFVGEVGLMIDYRFSKLFAARAGYELLWVQGVALAPDQSRSTNLLRPAASIDTSGTGFYHGAAASLEFVF